jgi:hypothetical protein
VTAGKGATQRDGTPWRIHWPQTLHGGSLIRLACNRRESCVAWLLQVQVQRASQRRIEQR